MSRHTAPALRTMFGVAALLVPLAACEPQPEARVALAQPEPTPTAAPAAASTEPLPYLRCGSERNPCSLEGITVVAPRQATRS